MKKDKTEKDDELRPEYDIKKLRLRKMGPERKDFSGSTIESSKPQPRTAGLHQGAARVSEDFDEPLPDEFWLGNQ